jgi:hypothetical protein
LAASITERRKCAKRIPLAASERGALERGTCGGATRSFTRIGIGSTFGGDAGICSSL